MKEELIEALKRGFMGRLDAAQTVADILEAMLAKPAVVVPGEIEKTIERLHANGHYDAADALADLARQDVKPKFDIEADMKVFSAASDAVMKAETVEIEVEPSPTSWAGLEKARADVVAEYFEPEARPVLKADEIQAAVERILSQPDAPPDPAPVKPKRKKA